MRLETLSVHAGEHPERNQGAVSTPIYQTATFVAEDTSGLDAINNGTTRGFVYSRIRNPSLLAVEEKLSRLEGAESSVVFGSGMAAIAGAIAACVEAGDEVVSPTDIYGGTYRYFTEVLPRQGITVRWSSSAEPSALAAEITPRTRLFYVETPTNPMLRLVDLAAVVTLARAHACRVVVDSTLGSPYNQRPLALGVDLVVHSASKYLNGHSDLLAGVVLGARALTKTVRLQQQVTGAILQPIGAWLMQRGLMTFALRVRQHNANGLAVAQFLETQVKVTRVHYPGLESHPQHALAQRQMSGFGGLLAFEMRGGSEAARRVVDASKLCGIGPSVGGVESLISQPAHTSHFSVPAERRAAMGITDGLIRLSVGIEAAEDLTEDLEQALSAA